MPIRKVRGSYKWGTTGWSYEAKIYPTKAGAQRQVKADHASGYRRIKKTTRRSK
jgi:hypothetical protein